MEIYERIEIIRKEFFGNNIKFAEAMDEKPTTTSGWCSGTRNIGINVIQKILEKIPNINDVWLYTGKGSMLLPESENLSENKSNLPKQNEKTPRLITHQDVQKLLTKQKEEFMSELAEMFGKFTDTLNKQIETNNKQIEANNNQIERSFTLMMEQLKLMGTMIGKVDRKADNIIDMNRKVG